MRLPLSWLKSYVDVKLSPDKLADRLTLSGTKVENVVKHGDDTVIHIEVTTNRPDCLSILGLSREVAALTGKKIKFPKISLPGPSKGEQISVKIEDKKGCPRYTARLMRGVAVKSAPIEIQKKLDAVGTRAINNVVDVTNFVLFEMGQPLHAFDLDKLAGGQIIVRRAKKDEKFLAIDGNEYTLDVETLVIADRDKVVAIAGVMGGKLTEVSSSTKDILLESAYFDPAMVRRASKKYKLTTESSYRFERGVDDSVVAIASARARDLIFETAGGKETGKFTDLNFIPKTKPKKITIDVPRINRLLGLSIPQGRIISILKTLGIPAFASGKNAVAVVAPSFRRDLTEAMDLAEEILRIEGFDKVSPAIPVTRHTLKTLADPLAAAVPGIKNRLAAMGFNEIVTYSLLSKKALLDSGFSEDAAERIVNPLSVEWEYFRPSLFAGALGAVQFNANRKAEALKFFEIGRRYLNGREETVLGLTLYGNLEENWRRKSQTSFYDLKGVVENVIRLFRLHPIWQAAPVNKIFDDHILWMLDSKPAAGVGEVASRILKNWDIAHPVYYSEMVLDTLVAGASRVSPLRVKPIPRFPSVRRDIAVVIEETVPVKNIEEAMRQAAPHLDSVKLFDEFKGKGIPQGKRSLAFSLNYQKDTGTFTDEEINALQARVGEVLKNTFKAEFR